MNYSSNDSEITGFMQFFQIVHKIASFVRSPKVELLLKVAALCLTLWWTMLFVGLIEAIEVLPDSFLPYTKKLVVLYVAHCGLWLAGTRFGKIARWFLILILIPSLVFYLTLAISKLSLTYLLGATAFLIGIIHILIWKPTSRRKP